MGRFFIEESLSVGQDFTLCKEDSAHIAKVLRHAVGDKLTLCDQNRTEYAVSIANLDANGVRVTVETCAESKTEPPFTATLFQALAKGDKMDTVVQKAVECGVCRIVPFESEHCVVKLDESGRKKKQERWQKIAKSAAEQCGRGIVPTVELPVPYAKALELAKEADCSFLCYEAERGQTLGGILPKQPSTVSFLVGPEGGFSPTEVQKAKDAGLASVGLGNRILRTETASSFVLSALVYQYELQ